MGREFLYMSRGKAAHGAAGAFVPYGPGFKSHLITEELCDKARHWSRLLVLGS